MSAESIRARLTAPVADLRWKLDRQLFALSPRASRLLAIVTIVASALMGMLMSRVLATTAVMPAFAQTGGTSPQVEGVLCNSGIPIGSLIAFGLAAISMFLLVKAIMQGTVAFNKLGSSRAQKQFEGKQALAGAGKTAAGAFVPPLFVALIDTLFSNMNIASCLMNGLTGGNIFAVVATLPF